MIQNTMPDGQESESPAKRLGTLYVASFLMIAVLTGFGQYFIIRQLTWQSRVASSVFRLVGARALEHPLSLAAVAVVSEADPTKRGALLSELRQAVDQRRQGASGTGAPSATTIAGDGADAGLAGSLARAERHRAAAVQAAERLLALLGREGPARPAPAEVEPLLRRIRNEEAAESRVVAEVAEVAGAGSVRQFSRLEQSELQLFSLVLAVLALEGFFVINPAIKRIQAFMRDLERSNEELKSYARRLERSNKELQDFASVASHDLQEPLRKVQAFSDRLKTRCAGALDAQGRDFIDRIQNASARMQTLINDLLTYARVSTRAQPFVPTDLATVTKEVLSDLETRIEQVGGSVEVGELPRVDADPLQVRQLMQNLIGNALKYKRPDVPPVVKISGVALLDGVAASASGPASTAAVADPAHERCQILIEDNGIGFEEVYAEKIFTIFQRLHGRTEYEGTGVGLAVCRKIVERHGGTITARSTPGKGSVFIVTLPMRQPKESSTDGCAA
jgi:signal transduction histidine kinase